MTEEFNPFEFESPTPTPEREEEYRQRIEQEIIHVEQDGVMGQACDGEPSVDGQEQQPLSEEELREAEEEAARQAKQEEREKKVFWQFISGNWLILEGITGTYRYLLIVAATLFLSVVSIFYSFHLNEKYATKVSSVQLLKERSLEYQQARFNNTSHSAIVKELRRRNIPLYDLQESKTIIER